MLASLARFAPEDAGNKSALDVSGLQIDGIIGSTCKTSCLPSFLLPVRIAATDDGASNQKTAAPAGTAP